MKLSTQLDLFPGTAMLNAEHHIIDQFNHVHRAGFKLQISRFEFRVVQNIVENCDERLAAALDGAQILFLALVKRRFDELGIEIPFPQRTLHWAQPHEQPAFASGPQLTAAAGNEGKDS